MGGEAIAGADEEKQNNLPHLKSTFIPSHRFVLSLTEDSSFTLCQIKEIKSSLQK